jgi:RNA methyltransferase, TrmH family
MIITSATNPKIKRLVGLRDRRDRDREKVFIVEGTRAVGRLSDAGRPISELYIDPDELDDAAADLVNALYRSGVPVVELSAHVMSKVSYRDSGQSVLAVCPQWTTPLDSLRLSPNPLVLVVEAVEKPGNLGAILRTADAVGCDAVVVCDPVVDLFNPNVVRSATAVLFSLPVATASPDHVLSWLRKNKLQIVATTPDTDLVYWDTNMRGPTAVLMGAEDDGLTQRWIHDADVRVRLPMAGQADSLNVGAATAVVLYEAVRQRS